MRVGLLSIALVGCTEDYLRIDAADVEAWEAAATRLASEHPADASPWLRDIGPDSALYDDAVLLLAHPWVDAGPDDAAIATLASKPGPHRHDAVLSLANRHADAPYDDLLAVADAWGLSDLEGEMVVQAVRWRLARSPSVLDVGEVLALDTRHWPPGTEAELLAGIVDLHATDAHRVAVLERLGPLLDPAHPEWGDAWTQTWFQLHGLDSWGRLLSEAPAHADLRWALLQRGQAHVGIDPQAAEADFRAILQGGSRGGEGLPEGSGSGAFTAAAAYYLTFQVARGERWERDAEWNPAHDEALGLAELAWEHGDGRIRRFLTDSAASGFARKLDGVGRNAESSRWVRRLAWFGQDSRPSPEGMALADELGLEVGEPFSWEFSGGLLCCRVTVTPATTVVPVVDTPDGPRALPAFQHGASPCQDPAVALGPQREAVAACVEAEIPYLHDHHESHIRVDDDGNATGSDALGECIAAIVEEVGIVAADWTIRVVDRR